MKTLFLSDTLSLPVKAVTEKMGWLGVTGSGKTYGATKAAELMLEAGAQICSIDPVGVWRGLRMGGNFPVYIFGGLSADYPLEPTAGALIADLLVDRNISAVLDISQFEYDTDRNKFLTAFADRLYFRKKTSRSALHLFMEECQEYIPQNAQPGEQRMLHVFQRIIKLGRFAGIGASLISQRPQDVNKKALNQCQTLFVFQLTGPQERKAVENWISDNGVSAADLNELLPKIKVGQPHIWSPTFLKVSETIKIRKKITADISITPEVGETATTGKLTRIDGDKLKEAMAETVERAKAEDPKTLRDEVKRLSLELAKEKAHPVHVVAPAKEVIREVSVLTDEDRKRLRDIHAALGDNRVLIEEFQGEVEELLAKVEKSVIVFNPARAKPEAPRRIKENGFTTEFRNRIEVSLSAQTVVGGGMRRMMIAMAQRPGINRRQLGLRAGLSISSGSFGTYLSTLRTKGWLGETPDGGFELSSAGIASLGDYQPLPSGHDLLQYWKNELGGGAARMLHVLAAAYPNSLPRAELGLRSEISHTGGSFGTYLSKLRTLELVTGRDELKASDELFD